eukprot:scaffold3474_cov246-Pinguiococcus_pyrenoidosus.AAC.7
MATATSDPFYIFRDELQQRATNLEQRHHEALASVNSTSVTAGDFRKSVQKVRFPWSSGCPGHHLRHQAANAQVKKELRHALRQLNDLEMTVRSVERDRTNFAHIDDEELQARKLFLAGLRARISTVETDVDSGEIKARLDRDEQEALKLYRPSGSLGAVNQGEMANTEYIHDQQAHTQLQMRQQDETLVELGESVDRVGLMAGQINEELVDQNKMLDDFETDLDRAAEHMNFMMAKLAKLLKTKDHCQLWVVIILAIIIVVLLFLIIYA